MNTVIKSSKQEEEAVLAAFNAEQKALAVQLKQDRAAGVPALHRLVELCETRDSGQVQRVAKFLAGLYNGYSYPFDLTELRAVDRSILDDCLAVLRMDSCPEREVHEYFENGNARFRDIFRSHGIAPLKKGD